MTHLIKRKRSDSNYEISLFHSEWFFPILLSYLSSPIIAKLDSVICDLEIRAHWLKCLVNVLKSIELTIERNRFEHIESLVDWIVLKKLDLKELSIIAKYGHEFTVTNYTMKKLVRCCPNLKNCILMVLNICRLLSTI